MRPKQTKSILFSLPEGTKPLNGRNEREQGGEGNRERTLMNILYDFMGDQTPPALGGGSQNGPTRTVPFDFQMLHPPVKLA